MVPDARHDAAKERDEQQQIDRGEPRRREHVESAQPVEERPERRMVGQILAHLLVVHAALGQHRARDRGEREEEEQDQRGTHAGELPP
jgi:hypothetical protein